MGWLRGRLEIDWQRTPAAGRVVAANEPRTCVARLAARGSRQQVHDCFRGLLPS